MRSYNTRTVRIRNVEQKPGIGKKRLENLDKAIRNRNRRLTAQVKNIMGEYTQENYYKLTKGQYVPALVTVDFSKVKTVKDYNALMRMLEADKTKQFKQLRTKQMRTTMQNIISRGLMIDADDDPELFKRISQMSDAEIIKMRRDNTDTLVKTFEYYRGEIALEEDERQYYWNEWRKAVGLQPLVFKKPVPYKL